MKNKRNVMKNKRNVMNFKEFVINECGVNEKEKQYFDEIVKSEVITLHDAIKNVISTNQLIFEWRRDTDMKEIPKEIINLSKSDITTLNFEFCSITKIHRNVSRLPKIKNFIINHNLLNSLPTGFSDMNINTLEINNNKIEEFPLEILKLKNLKWLDISNNQLKDIPEELFFLNSLTMLYINGNHISNNRIEELKMKYPNVDII